MTFVRLVKVYGRWYKCEVKTERMNGKVVQRYLRYLGPAVPRYLKKKI